VIPKEVWKYVLGVFDKPPLVCTECGSTVEEMESEYAFVFARFPNTSVFYGKVPYICKKTVCGKIFCGPSRKNDRGRILYGMPKRLSGGCCF